MRYGNNYLCKPQIGTSTTYPALPQFVESPIETELNAVQERLNKLLAKAFRDGYEAGSAAKYFVMKQQPNPFPTETAPGAGESGKP
jgi:hypothetical protein